MRDFSSFRTTLQQARGSRARARLQRMTSKPALSHLFVRQCDGVRQ